MSLARCVGGRASSSWAGLIAMAVFLGFSFVRSDPAATFPPDLLAATRAAVARFAGVDAALAAGYRPQPSDGPVVHYLNASYLRQGRVLDPRHPEALVYLRDTTGSLRLVAAMFMRHRPGQHGPTVDGSTAGWHTHTSCWGVGGLGIPIPGGACPEGTRLVRTPEMLHVWLIPVPGGPRATDMTAPAFRCDVAALLTS